MSKPKRTVAGIECSDDRVIITLDDGKPIILALSGDCCSRSYFERSSLTDLQSLHGQTIVRMEHVGTSIPRRWVEPDGSDEVHEGTDLKYHALKITTDQQELVVDWRNESNGCYDGWLTVAGFDVSGETP